MENESRCAVSRGTDLCTIKGSSLKGVAATSGFPRAWDYGCINSKEGAYPQHAETGLRLEDRNVPHAAASLVRAQKHRIPLMPHQWPWQFLIRQHCGGRRRRHTSKCQVEADAGDLLGLGEKLSAGNGIDVLPVVQSD
ncbi:g2378 [Coccomyxa viridis]|uniref:G2378 protein n=1 Tax=Coccomyxa viridis TaxID=1274662 RepID=A0ABP1FK84_9CHLO